MIDEARRDTAATLLREAPCSVVLPAGCGKTYLVAVCGAVVSREGKRLLVLTHTHAAVNAIRRRMSAFGVGNARILTIDSWCFRLVSAFPALSGHPPQDEVQWPQVHEAVARLLDNPHVSSMLEQSYDYVLVDEYQDCTQLQHAVVCRLAGMLPTVVLGDPLQALYDFAGDPVDWQTDLSMFPPVAVEAVPWRWRKPGANAQLGEALEDIRARLESHAGVDLRDYPIDWIRDDPRTRTSTCLSLSSFDGSVVILAQHANQCAHEARNLGGRFGMMEELQGKVMLEYAESVDSGDGLRAARATILFAKNCFSKLPSGLKQKADAMTQGFPGYRQGSTLGPLLSALEKVAEEAAPAFVDSALDRVEELGGVLFRKEAWLDVRRAVRRWGEGSSDDLSAAIRATRDVVRLLGQREMRRVVSRVRLVKGQEYDACVVLGADALERRELYVAVTRPCRRLSVMSPSPVLNPTS